LSCDYGEVIAAVGWRAIEAVADELAVERQHHLNERALLRVEDGGSAILGEEPVPKVSILEHNRRYCVALRVHNATGVV